VGQFVDHDITFDTTSAMGVPTDPGSSPNARTPSLDLDSVYGAGPVASPQLYDAFDSRTCASSREACSRTSRVTRACGVKKLDSVEISATTVAAVLRASGLAWLLARCRCAAARGCRGSALPCDLSIAARGANAAIACSRQTGASRPACPAGRVLWSDLEAIAGRAAAGADPTRRVASTGSENLQRCDVGARIAHHARSCPPDSSLRTSTTRSENARIPLILIHGGFSPHGLPGRCSTSPSHPPRRRAGGERGLDLPLRPGGCQARTPAQG
jgi:hypothetical protein